MGLKPLTIHFDVLPPAKWTFTVANVETAIIAADFIHYHHIVVDLANSWVFHSGDHSDESPGNTAAVVRVKEDNFGELLKCFVETHEQYGSGTEHKRNQLEHFQHTIETTGFPVFARA
ncbi:hypothetical protein TTRE_0000514601 [Trichuris trichiura]|uniref:Uncharacterized protein n=1 Tax=Trichuris trichiura TaxID=36087 RepID=A0A077ZBA5_TRITR|nr:hypothetical protein TTRE_0000514601 [Trichuris trichiura]